MLALQRIRNYFGPCTEVLWENPIRPIAAFAHFVWSTYSWNLLSVSWQCNSVDIHRIQRGTDQTDFNLLLRVWPQSALWICNMLLDILYDVRCSLATFQIDSNHFPSRCLNRCQTGRKKLRKVSYLLVEALSSSVRSEIGGRMSRQHVVGTLEITSALRR